MARIDLEKLGLDEAQLAAVEQYIAAAVKNETAEQTKKIKNLTANNEKLTSDLDQANAEIAKINIPEFEKKFRDAEKAWQEKLHKVQYDAAAKEAVADIKFSSNSAKTAFMYKLNEQKLALKEGSLAGFSEFLEQYKKEDPAAFIDSSSANTANTMDIRGVSQLNIPSSITQQPFSDEATLAFAAKGISLDSVKQFQNSVRRS